ncbi:NUMOD4 motif-containing HNH endonuclease [Mycobacterium sp. CnD-18-1]|uniref:NUMOD4 motif-containing HNH endonuclease n=1 Tax=Mycobacterium sp. CnD-18-1 TaxID=2917744 RepID=UPI0035B17A2B
MESTLEEWKPVVGYEGLYEVSSHGRIWSIPRVARSGRKIRGRIRKLSSNPAGYAVVILSRDGRNNGFLVHRLVLEAFVGSCPAGMEACHFDGIKSNNHLANLRWDTKMANVTDAVRIGSRPDPNRPQCARGHDLVGDNIYRMPRGGVQCRECKDWLNSRYRAEVDVGLRTVSHRDPKRTHCVNLHELTPENSYINKYGLAVCRECQRASNRRYKARIRAAS